MNISNEIYTRNLEALRRFGTPTDCEWEELVNALHVPPHEAMEWYERVKKEYGRFGRLYHNLDHIIACFQFKNSLDRKFSLAFDIALWFHDYIYWCGSKTNESDSVEVAQSFLRSCPDYVDSGYISAYILNTKHDAESDRYAKADANVAYFLDVDLSILGQEPIVYQNYSINVMEEYLFSGVSETDYAKGRYNFLDSLLKKDRIFHTKQVQAMLEEQARINIKKEMRLYDSSSECH